MSMAEQQPAMAASAEQAEQVMKILGEIAGKSRSLVEDFLARHHELANGNGGPGMDGRQLGNTFLELLQRWISQPGDLFNHQFELWHDYMRLWQGTAQRMMGQEVEPVIAPDRADRRFKDPAWNENPLFDFIKQSYLLSARFMLKAASDNGGVPDRQQQKVEFYTRQFVDALAPSNFVMTNPEVLRATVETRGENLLRGLKNMLEDLEAGKGRLKIKMTDTRRLRAWPEHRHHAGQGGLPERAYAAPAV